MNLSEITNKIIQGDCIEVMSEIPANSIDTIITDPPYGLEFMGKKWDYDVPSIEIWRECLRVLKPGGTALIFAGSRTQHRMAVNVEDAGFILKDCIMWLYGSGFPKATDISKQLDKVVGKQGRGFKVAGDDGRRAEFRQDKSFRSDYGYVWKPKGKEAKLWNGWKSHGLKPAYEPILVAMKPNDGSYANNALKHGVSGLNIDGGRIGTEEMGGGTMPDLRDVGKKSKEAIGIDKLSFGQVQNAKRKSYDNKIIGRFPANILLDEEAAKMLDGQSGDRKGMSSQVDTKETKSNYFGAHKKAGLRFGRGDSGGASRFFYVAKASKDERSLGCEGIEPKQRDESRKEGNPGGDNPRNRGVHKVLNNHPTVKPIKLMEYLCLLTKTPTGGIVLDPFVGSGTTCIAAKRQNRDFIGIEKEPEYCEIARARIKAQAKPMF